MPPCRGALPIIALMSLGDWTGGRPGATLADGWVFVESDLAQLPAIVRLAEAGYWTAPDSLVGPQRDGLRRRQAVRALNMEQLKVLSQLAGGYHQPRNRRASAPARADGQEDRPTTSSPAWVWPTAPRRRVMALSVHPRRRWRRQRG